MFMGVLTTSTGDGRLVISGAYVRPTARSAWATARRMARLALREEEDGDYREEPRGCANFAVHRIVDRETAPMIAGKRCEFVVGDCISDAGLTPPVWRVEGWDAENCCWHLFRLGGFRTDDLGRYEHAVDLAQYLALDTGAVTRAICVPHAQHQREAAEGGACRQWGHR